MNSAESMREAFVSVKYAVGMRGKREYVSYTET